MLKESIDTGCNPSLTESMARGRLKHDGRRCRGGREAQPVEGRVRAGLMGPGAALAKGHRLGPVQLEYAAGCTVTARRQEIDSDWAGERLGVELAFTRNSARCPTAGD